MRWSMKLFAPLCLVTVLLCGCAAKETADAVLHEGAVPLSAGLIYPAEIPWASSLLPRRRRRPLLSKLPRRICSPLQIPRLPRLCPQR